MMIRRRQVRNCETPPRAASNIRLAVLALITFTQPACLLPVPLAVYPEIEPGSGSTMEIYDPLGNPITSDGLIIINRNYDLYWPLKGAPSNSLIQIEEGKAVVPVEVAISLAGMSVGATPVFSIFFWIPLAMPFSDSGVGSPNAIILVPGYDVEVRQWLDINVETPSKIYLRSQPERHAASWQKIRDCLRKRFENGNPNPRFDLRFDHYHYWKARNFIEAELRRMNTMPDETNAASSGAGQFETSHSIAR